MIRRKLNVAIVGFEGHAIYATALAEHPLANPVGITDWDKRTVRGMALRRYAAQRGVPFFPSLDAMIDEVKFDAVAVLAPPAMTPDVVAKVAGCARAALLEKPAARDLDGARNIRRHARKHGLAISIAYPTRNFVQLVGLKQAVLDGKIGTPLAATYTYLQTNGPLYKVATTRANLERIAGGDDTMFLGYGVLDLEWVAGARIDTLHARGGAFFYPDYRRAGINDLAHVTFTMNSGLVGSITVGRITAQNRPAVHTIDVSGTGGAVSADFSKDRVAGWHPSGPRYTGFPQNAAEALVDDFVRATLAGRPAQYTVEDAFHTVAVQEAVKSSIASGKRRKVAIR